MRLPTFYRLFLSRVQVNSNNHTTINKKDWDKKFLTPIKKRIRDMFSHPHT